MRDKYNIIPMFMALLLHASFIASTLLVFDFSRPVTAATPLAIEATLVTADQIAAPPPPPIVEPEPEPEPEPVVPDTTEQDRLAAEEQKRLEELAEEQARIAKIEEQKRLQEIKEAEDRKRREEAEKERKREEAERKRQEEIERQRVENERLRQEAIEREAEELRLAEIAEEEARLAAMNSSEMQRYRLVIQQKIMRQWVAPASAQAGIECVVDVRQTRSGEVISAQVTRCNGDDAVRRSIEAAVVKASPFPPAPDPNLFQRDLRITFKPEE